MSLRWRRMVLLLWVTGCRNTPGIGVSATQLLVTGTGDGGERTRQVDAGLVTVDFGAVAVGNGAALTFNVQALGAAAVSIDGVSPVPMDGGQFALTVPNGQLPLAGVAGAATFAPQQAGAQEQRFTLSSDSSSAPQLQFALVGTGVAIALGAAPDRLDFGAVPILTNSTLTAQVINLGSLPVRVYALPIAALDAGALPGDGGSVATPFAVDPPLSMELAADGGSSPLVVHFAPQATGPALATVGLAICPTCPALTAVTLAGLALPSALRITETLDFGFVHLNPGGQSRTLPVRITNVTTGLTVNLGYPAIDPGSVLPSFFETGATYADSGAPVAFGAGTAPLLPGEEIDVPVTFQPEQSLGYQGTLTVNSDDPDRPQALVGLLGIGGGPQLSCVPSTLDFGQVVVVPGNPGHRQSTLCSNVGTAVPGHPEANLFLLDAAISPDGGPFTGNLEAPLPDGGLAPNQSFRVDLAYAPTQVGSDTGALLLTDNDRFAPPYPVALQGRAIPPQPCDVLQAPSIEGINFAQIAPGTTQTLALSLTNHAAAPCVVQGLQLTASSDPAFSLSPTAPVQQLSFAGDPNPSGDPLGLRVEVTATILDGGTGVFQGQVIYDVLQGTPQRRQVPLLAHSGRTCLAFQPSRIDFGPSTFTPQPVIAENVCDHPVSITSWGLWLTETSQPQFFIVPPSRDYGPLAPGQVQALLAVEFDATTSGQQFGGISILTDEATGEPYFFGLKGTADGTASTSCVVDAGLATPDLLCTAGTTCIPAASPAAPTGGFCARFCVPNSGLGSSVAQGCAADSQPCIGGAGPIGYCRWW